MKERYNFLDLFRGLAVINMVMYHFVWDLVYFGFNIPWYSTQVGYIWQQYICWSFIFVSGFSFHLGRKQLRRGFEIFAFGMLITAVTIFFVPQNKVIYGILTFLGSSIIIVYFAKNMLEKCNIYVGAVLSFALFLITKNISRGIINLGVYRLKIPEFIYSNLLTTYIGFPTENFYSADYFPLLPWIFLFICGFYTFMIFEEKNYFKKFENIEFAPIEHIARKALPIYMVHQVILYGIAYIFMLFIS